MAGETEKYLARIAQDRIPSSEEWQRRAMRILETGRAYDEQESVPSIWPGNTFNTVPVKPKPNNWLYNTLSDPKLNRGLETLAGNAADVILGRESGNALVDLGASNIPGIGAASILAAGGMPGIVDAVGAGELRNLKKIPKYTYEFVKEFFGDRGLRNLDNALTKYPKAGIANLNDAIHVLKTGLGGETVPALKPYRSTDAVADLVDMGIGNGDVSKDMLVDAFPAVINDFKSKMSNGGKMQVDKLANDFYNALEENNAVKLYNSMYPFVYGMRYHMQEGIPLEHAFNVFMQEKSPLKMLVRHNKDLQNDKVKRYAMLDSEIPQNWEKIVADQKYLDEHPEAAAEEARKAEEAALRAKLAVMSKKERKAYMQKLREQQAKQQSQPKKEPEPPKEQPKAEQPIQEKEAPEAQETPKGGPNMWRENGWDPNVKGDAFYGKFGGNLSDESKRDMFVLDSLANHWARQIVGEGKAGKLTDADIVDALDRAEARHSRSNYNAVSQGFYDDVKKNIASGNMPGRAVEFGPKYRKNVITNRDTPTLVLDPSEKPRFYNDTRIWADEQEGPDLYEMVFRPKSDEILNSINPDYWLYRR